MDVKSWAKTGGKIILGVAAILATAWAGGWTVAFVINDLYKEEKVAVEKIINSKIQDTESKLMAIRSADIEAVNGKFDFIAKQNGMIIQQNYQVIKLLKSVKSDTAEAITYKWKKKDQSIALLRFKKYSQEE